MEFDNWEDQIKESVTSVEQLSEFLMLSEQDIQAVEKVPFQFRVTPYYISLMKKNDSNCPIRRQALPSINELDNTFGTLDPLYESSHSPIPLIIKIYPDRVAFLVSNRCSIFCRHCLRKHTVITQCDEYSPEQIRQAIQYIKEDVQIRDVLLTGGDPLMLKDEILEWILSELRKISHVEIIRIGTRMVCTLPQRITESLCSMLEKYHPIWLNTQFNHPDELTEQARKAINLLLKAGIPVSNQSVLLKGINDTIETMKRLVKKLVYFRVRPYYIYQAQTLKGTEHFITPIETGINIIKSIRGYTSGLCEPRYVLDTPHGKIPINPNYSIGRENEYFLLRTYDDHIWKEYNPLQK